MTDKQLKRLSRRDLLEMLLELSKENEQIKEENQLLKQKLENRKIDIENCGSIAEAALKLSGIFQAAEEACQLYIENVRQKSRIADDETKEKSEDTASVEIADE